MFNYNDYKVLLVCGATEKNIDFNGIIIKYMIYLLRTKS